MNRKDRLTKILKVLNKKPTTKFNIIKKVNKDSKIVCNALKRKTGANHRLRGFLSPNMQEARDDGLVTLNYDTFVYSITRTGKQYLKHYLKHNK